MPTNPDDKGKWTPDKNKPKPEEDPANDAHAQYRSEDAQRVEEEKAAGDKSKQEQEERASKPKR